MTRPGRDLGRRRFAQLAAAALGAGALPRRNAVAAPQAKLWPRWEAHDPHSAAQIDHGLFEGFLRRYVVTASDGINRVAYGEIRSVDKAALDHGVNTLAATPISSFSRPEQMAYWINLYNALTVKIVVEHYPIDTIREIDISPGLFSTGPWGKKLVSIEGEALSLDDIEHQILRPIWQDPRVHYAVNCASVGCPNLRPTPFSAAMIDRELDEAAIAFVNHSRGVRHNRGTVWVSSIYRWFAEDFGGDDRSVLAHIKAFAAPQLAMALDRLGTIDSHGYDWALNDTIRRPASPQDAGNRSYR